MDNFIFIIPLWIIYWLIYFTFLLSSIGEESIVRKKILNKLSITLFIIVFIFLFNIFDNEQLFNKLSISWYHFLKYYFDGKKELAWNVLLDGFLWQILMYWITWLIIWNIVLNNINKNIEIKSKWKFILSWFIYLILIMIWIPWLIWYSIFEWNVDKDNEKYTSNKIINSDLNIKETKKNLVKKNKISEKKFIDDAEAIYIWHSLLWLSDQEWFQEALDKADEWLKIYPNSSDLYSLKWRIYQYEYWNYEEALKFYDKSISLDSDNYLSYLGKWQILFELWQIKKSKYCFEKASKKEPNWAIISSMMLELIKKMWY